MADKDLKYLMENAPDLVKAGKEIPMDVPQDYFESFPDKLMDKLEVSGAESW